jgi:hypothetical protein
VPPVDAETQAVLFNAVPLLIVAALYLAVGVARVRARGRDWALGFAAAGLAAAIAGVAILVTREPLAGHALVSTAAILLAVIPAIFAVRSAPAGNSSPLGVRTPVGAGPLSHRLLDVDGE